MRPNFLVIGAMKCGTTSLCHMLRQHPDVFVCEPKDTYFFSNDDYYSRGWSWYESLFAGAEGQAAIGEGTDNYTKQVQFPNTLPRLAHALPHARLIYIVRHPLEQIRSAWMHCRVFGFDKLPFLRAVREHAGYLDMADYLRQIDRYREFYPDNRIQVLFLEDLKQDVSQALKTCFRFLRVDESIEIQDKQPQNVFASHYGDRWVLSWLKRLGLAAAAKRILPGRGASAVRPLFKWRMKSKPAWDVETRGWIIDRIAQPTQEFLRRYGKPHDFWLLD